jgi:hypothetical protein
MEISIISEDCTNCVSSRLIETVIMKAVNVCKFFELCKLFVAPNQQDADTQHDVHCESPLNI